MQEEHKKRSLMWWTKLNVIPAQCFDLFDAQNFHPVAVN
jgi:hypothetical protein